MGRWWLDLLLVGAVFLGVRACKAPDVDTANLPTLSGSTLDGQDVQMDAASGPTVLHFWASWCGVCQAEASNIGALAKEARVITVASRSGPDGQVQRYLEDEGLSFPVLNDPTGQWAKRFGVSAFPTTFVLDETGKAVITEVGYTTLWGLRARVWWAGL